MQHFFRLMTMWIIALFVAAPSHASWRLDRYEATKSNASQVHEAVGEEDSQGRTIRLADRTASTTSKPQFAVSQGGSVGLVTSRLTYRHSGEGHLAPFFDVPLNTGNISATITIAAVFKWEGEGEPSEKFLITEISSLGAGATVALDKVKAMAVTQAETGLDTGAPQTTTGIGTFSKRQVTMTQVSSGGKTEVYGPSRTLTIAVESPGYSYNDMNDGYPKLAEVMIDAYYNAGLSSFGIGVSAPTFNWHKTEPLHKEVDAYANRVWSDQNEVSQPTTFEWTGPATYSAYISENFRSNFGEPKYNWDSSGNWADGDSGNSQDETKQATIRREHKLGNEHRLEGQTTTTNLIVTGDAESADLKGSVSINWYEAPKTSYQLNVEIVAINLETGEEVDLSGGTGSDGSPEGELEAAFRAKARTVAALQDGAEFIRVASNGQITIVLPDALQGKTYYANGGAALLREISSNLWNNFNETETVDSLMGSARARFNMSNEGAVRIRITRTTIITRRFGKMPPGFVRDAAVSGVLSTDVQYLGSACFVKGTLVSTQNGLRPIETLKQGDLVWSRDAATGTTQLKPIAQTFEKYATTLALTFSNGETIETTREHPFYVVGRGFVKAGELGIGTSIVTRAGPSVQLVSAKAGKAQTVYNFEVEDYHTYFVGAGEVWVHNTCLVIGSNLDSVMQGCPFMPGAQGTVSESIVNNYLQLLKTNPDAVWSRGGVHKIIISADGHILGGYHRIVAAQLAGVPIPESAIHRATMNAPVTRNWSEVIVQN